MTNKKTQKDFYKEFMAKYPLTDEEREFCEKKIAQLEKKSSSTEKKPTATQVANESLKAEIYDKMEDNTYYTITDLTKLFEVEISNQKMSALVRQLVLEGKVLRVEEKRKAFFSKVAV